MHDCKHDYYRHGGIVIDVMVHFTLCSFRRNVDLFGVSVSSTDHKRTTFPTDLLSATFPGGASPVFSQAQRFPWQTVLLSCDRDGPNRNLISHETDKTAVDTLPDAEY